MDMGFPARRFHQRQGQRQIARRIDRQMFGAHAIDHLLPDRSRPVVGQGKAGAIALHLELAASVPHHQQSRQKVHRRRAEEFRHEQVCRVVINGQWLAHLLDPAVMHDNHDIGHGHRLDLVMGHIDRGGFQALMQGLDLGPHFHPQLGIKVRQRLVEQKDLRFACQGAAHGDPLALPPRQLRGQTVQHRAEFQDPRRDLDPLCHDLQRRLAHLQPEGEVLFDIHMRVKRIGLEHHGDTAILGVDIIDQTARDADLTAGDVLQPRGHPQQGGFAAARGSDQHGKGTFGDAEVHTMQDVHRPELFPQVAKLHICVSHWTVLRCLRRHDFTAPDTILSTTRRSSSK